ncbi:MAG: EmrB/QacA family drug resistance transporter, partial [Acidimicrobiales bacterium]
VFLVAVPIMGLAFLLTWLLPEIRLRSHVGDETPPADGGPLPVAVEIPPADLAHAGVAPTSTR